MFTGLVEEIGTVNRINMGNNSGTIDIKQEKFLIIQKSVTVLLLTECVLR